MPTEQDTIQIPNASWWENNSYVIVREDFLAEDEAWIQNQMGRKIRVDNNNNKNPVIDMPVGNVNILLIQRMVTNGIVAVTRASGRVKTVSLPVGAPQLLKSDQDYIIAEINKLNPDMDEEEKKRSSTSANGHTATSSEAMNMSPMPS